MPVEQNVLLTGATGALGPSLAAELLGTDPSRTLHVLLRRTDRPAVERLDSWMQLVARAMAEHGGSCADWRDRVRYVEGDLRADDLDLTADARRALTKSCTCVIHAAADTKFLSTLDDLRNTNVEGTRRVLEFARSCRRLERVIQASTVFTSGQRVGRIMETNQSTPPGFVNNYERTKWEAEQVALESDLPLGIARISIAIGSHASGTVDRIGAFHQMIKWFMRGLMPVIPGRADAPADLICTEMVAKFIARAARADWRRGAIWHVAAGDRAGTLGELSALSFREAFPGEPMQNRDHPGRPFVVPIDEWDQVRLSKTRDRERLARQAMDAVNSFLPMFAFPRVYDTTEAERLWGGELPHRDWKQTFLKVVEAAGLAPAAREAAA